MRFIATYTLWGNLYLGRFYVNGKRVKEWEFDVKMNTFLKSGQSYTRKLDNMSATKYRLIWEKV